VISISIAMTPKEEKIKEHYDLAIIGGGPAGCSAAIYARRFMMDVVVISKHLGGLITDAELVDNYPGLPEISGKELGERFVNHAKKYKADFVEKFVTGIKKVNDEFEIKLEDGRTIKASTLIFATGETHNRLGVPGEEELTGKGVSYCAMCDAPLFKDKIVAVVGGGNTAFTDAQLLAKHGKKVYLIHRRTTFRADPIEVERVRATENIEFVIPYVVKRIIGENKVERLLLRKTEIKDGKIMETDETMELEVDGVFIDIGLRPNSLLAQDLGVNVNERGYIIVDEDMQTNIQGVYAAGDATDKASKFRQVVLAAAQGAIAAFSAYKYLKAKKTKK